MTKEYSELLENGTQYQDFLMKELIQYGFILMPYSSRKYQMEQGESYTRHEIKFDNRMKDTGNLYIETGERTQQNYNFLSSGIYRNDNSLHFIIGNYSKVFIFQKKILKTIIENGKDKFKEIIGATSKGILLPTIVASMYSIVINIKNNTIL